MWVSFSPSGGVAFPYALRPQQVGVLSVLIPHVCSLAGGDVGEFQPLRRRRLPVCSCRPQQVGVLSVLIPHV